MKNQYMILLGKNLREAMRSGKEYRMLNIEYQSKRESMSAES